MKLRCIVHIGPHKTGSSSIQRTLSRELIDPGFEYAKLGKNHGARIFSMFSRSPEKIGSHRSRGWSSEEIDRFNRNAKDKLVRAVREAEAEAVIFSGEAISNIDSDGLADLRQFLDDHYRSGG